MIQLMSSSADHYWDLVTNEIVRGDFGPKEINSKFAWLLSGPASFVTNSEVTVANLIISGTGDSLFEDTEDPLVCALKKFWGTESIGIKEDSELKNTNDEFHQNVQFDGTRYELERPWKENHPATSSDYELCVNRLHEVFAAKNVE